MGEKIYQTHFALPIAFPALEVADLYLIINMKLVNKTAVDEHSQ